MKACMVAAAVASKNQRPHEMPKLRAPQSYHDATPEERAKVCNGCGVGGWKGLLVPDTIYGVTVTEACHIHDWMYHLGVFPVDKARADEVFHQNLLSIINDHFKAWYLRPIKFLAKRRAYKYYLAVKLAGDSAFWANKVREDD